MGRQTYNILFLCTHNSARSILAEALVNHWGEGRFNGYSAGSFPKGDVHPLALALLQEQDLPTRGLRSKGWEEFARSGAPVMDFVITVCDQAAGELCPIWPGHPITAHWGVPDPASATGSDAQKRHAFSAALRVLEARIKRLVALPVETLGPETIKQHLQEIGADAMSADQEHS